MYILGLILNLITFSITGIVQDAENQQPVAGAVVSILETEESTTTDEKGQYGLYNLDPGTYTVQVQMLGYQTTKQTVVIKNENVVANFLLNPLNIMKEEVVVEGIRADEKAPFTQQVITQKQIEQVHYGQDLPAFLNRTTAATFYSDNGTGIGYQFLRIRGMDQSRINTTINGIPYNDGENLWVISVNITDILNSLQSIQIQRGVGTSSNGAASYGGSINYVTQDLLHDPAFNVQLGYGSFNSKRATAEYHTGLLKNKFAFYGRFSNTYTDGYRQNSGSNINSYMFSGGYFGKNSVLKFNFFGGKEQSKLAYLAIDKKTLDTNRRYNPLTRYDEDVFMQNFYQLQYEQKINNRIRLSASPYYIQGRGGYRTFVYNPTFESLNLPNIITPTDTITGIDKALCTYDLVLDTYGAMANAIYEDSLNKFILGVHGNTHSGTHLQDILNAELLPPGTLPKHRVYENTGYKTDMSAFIKAQRAFGKLLIYGDAQIRNASFRYLAKDFPILRDTFKVDPISWTFFNPKAGVRYEINKQISVYSSIGMTTREPARIDMFGGLGERAYSGLRLDAVKPESVVDIEIGLNYQTKNFTLQANLYNMNFRNEIVATGEYNAIGIALKRNTPQSFRRGIEWDWTWRIAQKLYLTQNMAISQNKIKEFTQFYTVLDEFGNFVENKKVVFKNTNTAYSPSVIGFQSVRYVPKSWLFFEVAGKYVSKIYLDNTSNENLTIPGFFYADFAGGIYLDKWLKHGKYLLKLNVNNFTNTHYSMNGYTYSFITRTANGDVQTDIPFYFPQATLNYFITLDIRF
ncbi:MAG: TonB-dependent receptor [Bacteroidia bacterium]|nr:TonB-dependent receptor [Bacteroidia bacterium]